MPSCTSTIPPVPKVVSGLPLELYRTSTVWPDLWTPEPSTNPPTSIWPLGCTMTADGEGKGPLGVVVTRPLLPKVASNWPLGLNRAIANSVAVSTLADAVPTTTMSPLDCTATAIGLLMPSVKNDALVAPIRVPSDVYRTRPKTSKFGKAVGLMPVTTAMSPLDCSMAVKVPMTPPPGALGLPPIRVGLVVTIPPVPKVVSRVPAVCAMPNPDATPTSAASVLADLSFRAAGCSNRRRILVVFKTSNILFSWIRPHGYCPWDTDPPSRLTINVAASRWQDVIVL